MTWWRRMLDKLFPWRKETPSQTGVTLDEADTEEEDAITEFEKTLIEFAPRKKKDDEPRD